MKRRIMGALLGLCLVATATGQAQADFPEKNIKIVVPFAPGGAVDFISRLIADVAAQHLNGKKIIVENMPGGGAVIGQAFVAQAAPDGYTVLAYTSSVVNNPILKKTNYTYKSFQPLALYCIDPEVIVVSAASGFTSVTDLVMAAKDKPVSVATPGHSTSHHIAALAMAKETGIGFTFIHNESAAMQTQQLLGGHVQAAFMSMGEALSFAKDERVRLVGLMAETRSAAMPEVPTLKEQGLPALDHLSTFRGLAVPKDTPPAVVEKLADVMQKTIADANFASGMEKAGYPVAFMGPDDFLAYIEKVAATMGEILPELAKKQ